MTTIGSGQSISPDMGATDWRNATAQGTPDRRPAGQNGGIVQLVRETTLQRLGDQKARASDTLGTVAGAVRGVTQQLRDGGQPGIADYANRAADGMERWATQLRQHDVEQALRSVQRFARREPALFLGLAFGAGLLAARFLKSSNDNQRQYSEKSTYFPPSSPAATPSYSPAAASYSPATPTSPTTGADAIPRVGPNVRSAEEAL